jgi:apolipoprotein D and lipocalin family protein
MNFKQTVDHVELSRFLTKWYVIAGRTTLFEKGAHNSVESYTWNESEKRIDVDFHFNKNAFNGQRKEYPQKAWVSDEETNAHWKVQPIWPLKFDYLIIALDPEYKWTAIGVPSGAYLWIMASTPKITEVQLGEIINEVKAKGYPVQNIALVPQQTKRQANPKETTVGSANSKSRAKKTTPKASANKSMH